MTLEILEETLDLVDDDEFCAQFCMKAPVNSQESVLALLEYATSRVSTEDEKGLQLFEEIQKVHRRFKTYQALQQKGEEFSFYAWNEFRLSDMIEEVILRIIEHHFDEVAMIWLRHHLVDKFMSHLETILHSFPSYVKIDDIVSFVKENIVPYVTETAQM